MYFACQQDMAHPQQNFLRVSGQQRKHNKRNASFFRPFGFAGRRRLRFFITATVAGTTTTRLRITENVDQKHISIHKHFGMRSLAWKMGFRRWKTCRRLCSPRHLRNQNRRLGHLQHRVLICARRLPRHQNQNLQGSLVKS